MDGSRDPGIVQFQTIVNAATVWLRGKSGRIKGSVKVFTGTISSEHASSTVSTMCSRGQPKYQEPGGRIAKRWHRSAPINPIDVSSTFRLRDLAAVPDQARTPLALCNFLFQRGKVLFVTFG